MSLRTPIPVIETERLVLRGPRDADLPAYAQYFTTPRADFTGGQRGEVETYTMLMILAGHWHMRGYGLWVIEHRETGKTAGWTGILHHLDWPEPELGWAPGPTRPATWASARRSASSTRATTDPPLWRPAWARRSKSGPSCAARRSTSGATRT
jgi:hypothetical protein